MIPPFLNNAARERSTKVDEHGREESCVLNKTLGEGVNVLGVQCVRRLIQSQDPAVLAKRVRECKANDDRSQHLLSRRASSSHVHLDLVLRHHDLYRLSDVSDIRVSTHTR